jgi:hypothetical protein
MLMVGGDVDAWQAVKQNTPQKEVTQRNFTSQINTHPRVKSTHSR